MIINILFKYSLVGYFIAFSIILRFLNAPNYTGLFIFLQSCILFSVVDYLAWERMVKVIEDENYGTMTLLEISEMKMSYRIIQNIIFVLIIYFLFRYNYKVAIAFVVSWNLLVCDALYYIIGKNLYPYAKYTWFNWSVITLFGVFPNVSRLRFIISSSVGLILGVVICII